MSLYSHNFQLLPRPPRSTISFVDESTRAQLPDFANVDELRTFVRRLFVYQLSTPGVFVQLKLGASIICVLVVVVGAIIARRMYDRSFWIIRIMKRPSGAVIVPNAMLCFSIIEGAYGGVFVALMWMMSRYYEVHNARPDNFILWLTLTWIPLIIGATWAAWGTYFATPSRTQAGSFGLGSTSIIRRFFEHSLFINCLGLFFPIVIIISVTIPSAIATHHYHKALNDQEAWLAKYANATTFTQTMVQEAQTVWYELFYPMKLYSITYYIWTFWALCIFVVYSYVALRLMVTLRGELRKSKAAVPRRGIVATTRITSSAETSNEANNNNNNNNNNAVVEGRPQKQLLAPPVWNGEHGEKENGTTNYQNATPIRDTRKASLLSGTTANHGTPLHDGDEQQFRSSPNGRRDRKAVSSNGDDGSIEAIPMQHTHSVRLDDAIAAIERRSFESVEREHRRTYIPNIIYKQQSVASAARPKRDAQRKELQKALIHISIQFFAISPACVCFMFVALFLGVCAYGGTEKPFKGGNFYEYTLTIALLIVNWVTCLFGAITVLAIAQRTYEPVFSNLHLTSTIHSNSAIGLSGDRSNQQVSNDQTPSQRNVSELNTPRSRHSFGLGRMLGRPQRSESLNKRDLRAYVNEADRHDKSTFFETHTRHQQQSDFRGGNASSSGSELIPHLESIAPDESMIDIEGAAAGPRFERNPMDIANRGLFIERTVVTVEEESQQDHDESLEDYDAAAFSPPTKSANTASSNQRNAEQRGSNTGSERRRTASGTRFQLINSQSPRQPPPTEQVDSDEDDEYFRGGAGRRNRTSRSTQPHESGTAY